MGVDGWLGLVNVLRAARFSGMLLARPQRRARLGGVGYVDVSQQERLSW